MLYQLARTGVGQILARGIVSSSPQLWAVASGSSKGWCSIPHAIAAAAGGDALIYGQSISSAGGINTIRSLMGVCPQFDVLWNELTAKEHLEIYGSVKVRASRHCMAQRIAALYHAGQQTLELWYTRLVLCGSPCCRC